MLRKDSEKFLEILLGKRGKLGQDLWKYLMLNLMLKQY